MAQDEVYPVTRVCYKCGDEKLLTSFPRHKGKKLGRDYRCNDCASGASRIYHADHVEERHQYFKDRRAHYRALNQAWRDANKERWLELSRGMWERRKHRHNAARRLHRKPPTDSERLRGRLKAHRRRGAEGSFTQADVDTIYQAQKGRCYYCGIVLTSYHIDHKQPLARGGTHLPRNLAVACADCNLSKGKKTETEFVMYLAQFQSSSTSHVISTS